MSTDISAMGAIVGNLMTDLRQIIDEARIHVASTANYELTMMYWHIGERINRDVLGNERATYGKQIIATVSRQLQAWYGSKGFEERTIRRMVQFAQEFPDWQIVSPLVSKLSWTHFLTIMTLKDPLQREFYLTMAANERWSKRTLQSKIDGMLYERTALSSKPEEVAKQELANVRDNKVVFPDVVRHGRAQASLALLIWLIEKVGLRPPFLAMAELKRAWPCSFGLSKRFCQLSELWDVS